METQDRCGATRPTRLRASISCPLRSDRPRSQSSSAQSAPDRHADVRFVILPVPIDCPSIHVGNEKATVAVFPSCRFTAPSGVAGAGPVSSLPVTTFRQRARIRGGGEIRCAAREETASLMADYVKKSARQNETSWRRPPTRCATTRRSLAKGVAERLFSPSANPGGEIVELGVTPKCLGLSSIVQNPVSLKR